MQKITPHLWFDKEAKEAATFYVSAFGESSKVGSVQQIHDTPHVLSLRVQALEDG